MTNTTIHLTEEEFDEQYRLVANHLNPNASWAYGEGGGCLFETYGEELAFVRQQAHGIVWTLVDGDDGDQYLLSGYHLVNRIGYLITTTPVPDNVQIEVRIPTQPDKDSQSGEPKDVPSTTPDLLLLIAQIHLRIPTLETRRSDGLDFHDVSVWAVKDALEAAYEAGASSRSHPSGPEEILPHHAAQLPVPFDGYEIYGIKRLPVNGQEQEPVGWVIENREVVPDAEADFWSIYGHIPGEGVQAIGDFDSREQAEEVFARITGRSYNDGTPKARR